MTIRTQLDALFVQPRPARARAAPLAIRRRCSAALAVAALLAAGPAAASDRQAWSTETVTLKLSDRWSFSQDLTTRFSDDRHGLYDVEANSLVGYHLNGSITIWAGYDHDPQY